MVSLKQWQRVQGYIQRGMEEGAQLLAGGPGLPEGLEAGWFAKPTVFSRVTNQMSIAREEIFGPLLSVITYQDEAQALAIANDTPYGLQAYILSSNPPAGPRAGQPHRCRPRVDQYPGPRTSCAPWRLQAIGDRP